jgi:hypothetical protein
MANTADKIVRLWAGDNSLWTNQNESSWLGWLNIVDKQIKCLPEFQVLCERRRRVLRIISREVLTKGFLH